MCQAFTAAFLEFEIAQLDAEFDALFAGLPVEYRAAELTGSFGDVEYTVEDSEMFHEPSAAEADWSDV